MIVSDGIRIRIGENRLQITLHVLESNAHVFLVKLRYSSDSRQNISSALLTMMDTRTAELKSGLDSESDRVSFSLEYPDLIAKSINVPLQQGWPTCGLFSLMLRPSTLALSYTRVWPFLWYCSALFLPPWLCTS